MTTMSLELPMLTMAKQVQLTYEALPDDSKCTSFYVDSMSLDSDSAKTLCDSSTYFDFSNPFNTSVALTNMYLYQDVYNRKYFDDYTTTLSLDPSSMSELMYSADSSLTFTTFFNNINGQLYKHYSGSAGVCESLLPDYEQCAFSNLTNAQWLDLKVLGNPLDGQDDVDTNYLGYTQYYKDYVSAWITPEYGYWRGKNKLDPLAPEDYALAIETMYSTFTANNVFNQKIFQDVLLGIQTLPAYTPSFDRYLRFLTVNFGLGGLVSQHTPREMIEGYEDPLVA